MTKTGSSQVSLATVLACGIHEIKNNFGRLQVQLSQHIPPEHSAYSQIEQEIQHLGHQLSQVLMLYKSHTGCYSLNQDDLEILLLLKECQARHPQLDILISADPNLLVFADEYLLTNLLDTLVYNSQQAGANQLTFDAVAVDEGIRIRIEDNGPGFSTEQLASVSLTTAGNANGLGLQFAKELLAAHKHASRQRTISLANRAGQPGACIDLWLP